MKALLVGLQLPRTTVEDNEASLRELGRLVHTLGHEVIGQLTQKRNSDTGATVLGEGKLVELSKWTGGTGKVAPKVEAKKTKAAERMAKEEEPEEIDEEPLDDETDDDESSPGKPNGQAEIIVFDHDLTPSQLRNLESATGVTVLDRTGVIIEIFSRHARTKAARLQVEIARLNYLAPRIRETGGGGSDRQGGGVGGKGAGETSYELDRRRIRDRIKELKTELESVQGEHLVRSNRRSSENCVALVGYTNAGKSSLMRAMTGSEIYVADKLFATLDTTVRPVYPETTPKILLSDTVGFIKKLPHDLVASFRSTLDEALNADLLLYVVDASDPTFRSQLQVTQTVLHEIGAQETPSKLVLNKRDRLKPEEYEALKKEYPDAIFLSALDKEDLKKFRLDLVGFFEGDMIEDDVFVPYTTKGAVGEIRGGMRVLSESFDGQGVKFRVRAPEDELKRLRRKYSL